MGEEVPQDLVTVRLRLNLRCSVRQTWESMSAVQTIGNLTSCEDWLRNVTPMIKEVREKTVHVITFPIESDRYWVALSFVG